eukprot:INCI414.1.p1 GENE.INCI414.1~~INCI414.1.p1  ORF type:complete len:260 (-),score=68.66 INCI414.1:104-883(-)
MASKSKAVNPTVKALEASMAAKSSGKSASSANSKGLGALLKQHSFLTITPMNRIHCSITNHDIVPDASAVEAHLASKAFRRANLYAGDFSQFEPYLLPHKYSDKKLYCTLTKKTLNKIMPQVLKHVAGRKFRRLKTEFEEKKAKKEARAKRKAEKAARYAARQKLKEEAAAEGRALEDDEEDISSSDVSSSSDSEDEPESSDDEAEAAESAASPRNAGSRKRGSHDGSEQPAVEAGGSGSNTPTTTDKPSSKKKARTKK